MDQEKVSDNLISKIKKKKLQSSYFDDFVHITASHEAAKINNKGLSSQINYLLKTGWSKKDVEDVFK